MKAVRNLSYSNTQEFVHKSNLNLRLKKLDTFAIVFSSNSVIDRMCAGLVCISFLLLAGCGTESANWRYAQARNCYAEGDLAGAIEILEVAHELAPENVDIKLDLASFYAENGQCDLGIGLCGDYLKDYPGDLRGHDTRSRCLMFLGNFEEALKDYKVSLSGHISRSNGELNNLAYYRGLAGVELDKAAHDIQEAITELEVNRGWGAGPQLNRRVSLQVRTLVAAGLVSRHIDRHEEVIEHLSRKIVSYRARLNDRESLLKNRVTVETRTQVPFPKNVEKKLLELRSHIEYLRTSISAMLATRALVYEDLGKTKEADLDRLLIDEFGFDFKDLVDELPTDFVCLDALDIASTFLDTRGFVLGRQKWREENEQEGDVSENEPNSESENPYLLSSYLESLEDLNLAILSSQFNRLAMDSPLYNTPDLPAEYVAERKTMSARTTAVLLHHRRELHLRAGNEAGAARDSVAIEKLGFRDSTLY